MAVNTGYIGVLFGFLVVMCLLLVFVIKGGVWVGRYVYPFSALAAQLALAASVLIFLPLSFIRHTYGFSSAGLVIASMIMGLAIWVSSLLVTYQIWDAWGVIIGLVFMGVGVVPIALLATLVNGMWGVLGKLVLSLVIMWVVRIYAHHVAQKP